MPVQRQSEGTECENCGPRALAALLAAASAQAAEKVTYLLPAPAFLPAFGPWMLAKQRGYFAAEGLDVEFQAAQGGADAAKQVGAGNAVIGGAIGDTPIIVRANGVPVKAVALLGGGGLMQLVLHEDSPLKGPQDLKGKTVTVLAYQDTTYYALLGMLAKVGLSKNDVNIQAAGATNVWKLFVAGQADAMASVPDWEVDATEAGAKIRVIQADQYFQSMAQAVVASDDTIKAKPDLIKKLVAATIHGVKDIMTDPEGAARDYVKAVPQRQGQERQMARVFQLYDQYVYPGQKKLGAMDEARLAALQDFLSEAGHHREGDAGEGALHQPVRRVMAVEATERRRTPARRPARRLAASLARPETAGTAAVFLLFLAAWQWGPGALGIPVLHRADSVGNAGSSSCACSRATGSCFTSASPRSRWRRGSGLARCSAW